MSGAQTAKFLDFPFTTKVANSIIDVKFNCQIYVVNNNTGNVDADIALAAGFKTGSATSSSTDYTAITTYAPTRQNITFSGSVTRAIYASDAYEVSSSHAHRYNPLNAINYQESFSPSLAAGTTIRVATPRATPKKEYQAIVETPPSLLLALKYRKAIKISKCENKKNFENLLF